MIKRRRSTSLLLSAAMLLPLVTIPATAVSVTFGDMQGHWSAPAVDRWSAVKVFHGDEKGNFNPDKSMTRAELAQTLVNLMGYTEESKTAYTDVAPGAWYESAIRKLDAAGVMQGYDGKAMPTDPVSREQTAVLLCRAMGLQPKAGVTAPTFTDSAAISDWAKDAVNALSQRGMLNGVGDGRIAPRQDVNRGSVAQMLDNMISTYVTEDGATVQGEQKGVVIVVSSKATFQDASFNETLIVAPKAGQASVTLAGKTAAGDVAVAAAGAKLMVEKDAAVNTVTVQAAKASVEVAGKAENVETTETASGAEVIVVPGADVKNMNLVATGGGNESSTTDKKNQSPIHVNFEEVDVGRMEDYDEFSEWPHYAIISGIRADGSEAWSVTTEKIYGIELANWCQIGVTENLFYYHNYNTIFALEVETGKLVWKNNDLREVITSDNGCSDCKIGKNGELFICDGVCDRLLAIDAMGNTFFLSVANDDVCYNAQIIDISYLNDNICVTTRDDDGVERHYSIFNHLTDKADMTYVESYKTILGKYPVSQGNENTEYALYDIDKNGVPELIIKCPDAWNFLVYTYDGKKSVSCGKIQDSCFGSNAELYGSDGNGIVIHGGGIGPDRVERVYIQQLVDNNLIEGSFYISTENKSFEELYSILETYTPINNFYRTDDFAPFGK